MLALTTALLLPVGAYAVTLPNVGDTIYNPTTAATETVTRVIAPAAVVTSGGYVIFVATTVGDTYVDPTTGDTMKIVSVTKDASNNVTSVVIQDLTNTSAANVTQSVAMVVGSTIPSVDGSGFDDISSTPGATSQNVVNIVKRGKRGSNGDSGGGVKIFGVCICYDAEDGGKGANGPNIT